MVLALADVLEYAAKRFQGIVEGDADAQTVKVLEKELKKIEKKEKASIEVTPTAPIAESPVTIEEEPKAVAMSADEMKTKCVPIIAEVAKREGGREVLMAFFAKFGGKRLGDIKEEQMPEFYDGIREL